jgi:hypothetical protein
LTESQSLCTTGDSVLDRVPLLEKNLDDYAGVVGSDVVERIRELAA